MIEPQMQVTVFWFRSDLRLNNNHGLFNALTNTNKVLPLYIFDTNIFTRLNNNNQINIIKTALKNINIELQNYNSTMLVLHDSPAQAFVNICKHYNVTKVIANAEYEPYTIARDAEIKKYLETQNIIFEVFDDKIIFNHSQILKPDTTPYTIFTPYSKKWLQKLSGHTIINYSSEKLLGNFIKTKLYSLPGTININITTINNVNLYSLPNTATITNYHKTRDIPYLNQTSFMSIPLKYGTISIRELVQIATKLNHVWLNELIWREFFIMILFYYPKVVTNSFKPKYDNINWLNNSENFNSWSNGKTGYPFVDAAMNQLNQTGFMHNRTRMVTASFLTKHLLIDWRLGEAYFAQKLTDYDLAANNGNWQWAAGCGCDAVPYFRVFNPTLQQQKFDPNMLYIKKYISNFNPNNYIKPIVDHNYARQRAIDAYKKALT